MHEIKMIILCIFFIIIDLSHSELLNAINTDRPPLPSIIHPLTPLVQVLQSGPIPTNKFWTNFLVSPISDPAHVHPYVVKIERNFPYGLAISHAFFLDDKISGVSPDRAAELNGRLEFYFNILSNDAGFSATEITATSPKYINYHDIFGCHIQFGNNGSRILFPLIRGMAYVTAEYENLTPVIFTIGAFINVNGQNTGTITSRKFVIETNTNQKWILYVLGGKSITLNIAYNQLTSTSRFTGTLRIARIPKTNMAVAESLFDLYSERIVTGGDLDIQTNIDPANPLKASYTFTWKTKGSGELVHFALPHHVDILTVAQRTGLKLWSTTKGELVGYTGSTWKLIEDGLTYVKFLPPFSPDASRIPAIIAQVTTDIQQFDTYSQTTSPSNYFAGKGIAKIALLCLIAKELKMNEDIYNLCMSKAKQGIYPYIVNSNLNSFRYEPLWGGIIGHNGINCDNPNIYCPGMDFGASYYNDHHYHYGYFVHAAAVLAHLDYDFGQDSKDWVENLIRDVSNPSYDDTYFPRFRSFDWYTGHSWSQGLFASGDGKDQESTSEEINFHYGLMLWGIATRNPTLEKLGNVMFGVAKRSIQKYFLMKSNNVVHPPNFVKNKVTGIFFENKVQYTTWFGPNPEYIHGIQMLPFLPINEIVRDYDFVKEEWDSILSKISVPDNTGWKSILYLNYATLNKAEAWNVLSNPSVKVDEGLSRGWALYSIASRYSAPLPPYIPSITQSTTSTSSQIPTTTTTTTTTQIPPTTTTTTTQIPPTTTTTTTQIPPTTTTTTTQIPITTTTTTTTQKPPTTTTTTTQIPITTTQISTTTQIPITTTQIPTITQISTTTTTQIPTKATTTPTQISSTTSSTQIPTTSASSTSDSTTISQSETTSKSQIPSPSNISESFAFSTTESNSTEPALITVTPALPQWLFILIIIVVCSAFTLILGGVVLLLAIKKKICIKIKK